MISIEINSEPDNNWNKRMLEHKIGTFSQTKEFALSRKLMGHKPFFLKFFNNSGKIIGQLLFVINSKSAKNGKIKKFLKSKIIKTENCRWVYGPVVFDPNFNDEISSLLKDYFYKKKIYLWGSEPPLNANMLKNFGTNYNLQPWATFLINLKLEKNEIWNKMNKKSVQKNIERSIQRNVVVKEITDSDVLKYEKLKQEMKKDQNNTTEFKKHWKIFQPSGYTGFLAYKEEIPIGGIMVSSFNGYINEFGIVRTKQDKEEKLYSQDLLKWKIIEWGLQKNFNFYDLSGVNPLPTNQKEDGIFRYKEKWGGELIKYNIVKS